MDYAERFFVCNDPCLYKETYFFQIVPLFFIFYKKFQG